MREHSYFEEWCLHLIEAVVCIPICLYEATHDWWRYFVTYHPRRRFEYTATGAASAINMQNTERAQVDE